MADEPESRYSRRTVLSLAGGTAGLGIWSTVGAGRRIQNSAGRASDTPSLSAGVDTDPTESLQAEDWIQNAKLTAEDGEAGDFFGRSVTVSSDGTTAIVGARRDENPQGGEAGAAYVFDRSGDGWTEQAKLISEDLADTSQIRTAFGSSVAVSEDGTTAIIGAGLDDNLDGTRAGSAYVFTRSDDTWTQQAKLVAGDGGFNDFFGFSVAVSDDGTTAVVGAVVDDPNGGKTAAAYVFDGSDDTWSQQVKMIPDDGDSEKEFSLEPIGAFSVDISGDGTTVAMGAYPDDSTAEQTGSAYVFTRGGGEWSQQAELIPDDGNPGDRFGTSVTISDDGRTTIVGAYADDGPDGENTGSAYVFAGGAGEWAQQAKLIPAEGSKNFGFSVAVSDDGTTALVGARYEDANSRNAGSAYVFDRGDDTWTQQARMAADDGDRGDAFGASVAVSDDGTTAIIGAVPGDRDTPEGSAYVFDEQQSESETSSGDSTTEAGATASDGETTEPDVDGRAGGGATEAKSDEENGGSTPGFGVGSLLTGLLGIGYLRWRDTADDTKQ